MIPRRSFGERLVEWVLALILLGIVTEVFIGFLVTLVPYIIIGLGVLGAGALIVRRMRGW